MTVPASPSIAASAVVTGTFGALAAGPHRNGTLRDGARTMTFEWAFQSLKSIVCSSNQRPRLFG
jgi:hypothetical protein